MEHNKEKIEEMARDICKVCVPYTHCETDEPCAMAKREAEEYYKLGYRKASEVAEEIFEEIETEIEAAIESNYRAKKEHKNHSVIPNYDNFNAMCDGKIYAMRGLLDFIAELKKKYIGESDNG